MHAILFATAFLLICLGVVAIAAIPFLFSLARRNSEVAESLNVQTQFQVKRYNSIIEAYNKAQAAKATPPPPPPRKNHLQPIKGGKDGPRKNDDHPPKL